jgi:protein SCO1
MKGQKIRAAALVAAVTGLVLSLAALRPERVAAESRWGANYFPDVTLTTQDGETVKFYDLIKGRIVAIDLIYTNCQYACPLESARLARMQQILGARMGRDVFFISISIDPEHDTPAALKAYAAKYDAGPGWIFLTGTMSDIDLLSRKLGLWSDPTLTQDGHTPMLLIGNEAAGQWTMTSALDNPAYTAKIIGSWMNSFRTTVGNSTTDPKPIVNRDNGKYLYGSLCANCHTIGRGDKIGPDLATSLDTREREWLTRYTVEPDVVRAKNDPIAAVLKKKFPQVRMPNLGLNVDEVKSVLHYVELQKSHTTNDAHAPAATADADARLTRSSSTPSTAPLLEPAIAIHTALAHDTMVGVVAEAKMLREAAAALGPNGAAIATAAADLEKQTTIAEARRAFGTMSDALVAYVRAGNVTLGGGVRIAYCPMLRKPWIQKDGPVENPYYGSRMLACGELTN